MVALMMMMMMMMRVMLMRVMLMLGVTTDPSSAGGAGISFKAVN